MILQVVVSGFLREPFREDLGIFIIWDDPPSAVGFVSGLDITSGKVGDQFPGWHAERTQFIAGVARERGGLELSAQPVGHFKMVVV